MANVPPISLDYGVIRPKTFWVGSVNLGSSFTSSSFPGQALCWLIQGIDVYAGTQPDNGDFQIFLGSVGWPVAGGLLYRVQQSANFPGPYYWRGCVPIFHGNNSITVDSTVPFDFVIWGAETLDFTVDTLQSFP